MIRVLHMIGSLNIGGSQSMIMNLYRNIDREQIQFDFVIDHPSHLYYAEEIKKLGGCIHVMEPFKGSNTKSVKKAWNTFFDEHPEYRILHSHVRSYASLYIPIAKKHGVKTIIHSHSTSNGKGIASIVKAIMQFPLRYQADYFFGCSREAGKWLFGKKIVNSKRYFMLKNAIDTKKYEVSMETRKIYRTNFGATEVTNVLVHVGRFHESKNHMFLLDVFQEYNRKHRDSILVLVGDGELRERIEEHIKELDLEENVNLLGNRNDVAEILQAADYFLFPSNWEGLPVTVVEAQAAGLPCFVSSNVTKDVNVSELVLNLPINQGTEVWVEAIEKSVIERKNVMSSIVSAGFDITSSSAWLTKFYSELLAV